MEIPRAVVGFNRAVNNPIQRQYAWLLPPWAIVVHRGRRSGRTYRTPVVAFRRDRELAVVILYGERSDWVQNALAGGAEIVRGGHTFALVQPRVVSLDEARPSLSAAARAMGRASGKLLVGTLEGPSGRFGRGPAASPTA
jgi:deazaflavin-dependent oxidoreductase (nitroreductase family)